MVFDSSSDVGVFVFVFGNHIHVVERTSSLLVFHETEVRGMHALHLAGAEGDGILELESVFVDGTLDSGVGAEFQEAITSDGATFLGYPVGIGFAVTAMVTIPQFAGDVSSGRTE